MPVNAPAPDARLADGITEQTAFAQAVQAIQQTFATAPLGWALMGWVCWGRVEQAALLTWLALFAAGLTVNLLALQAMRRAGPDPARHGTRLLVVALLDGLSWGAVALLLMGDDAILNAWIAAILCGVAAANAPAYITWIRCYRMMLFGLWILVALATLAHPGRPQAMVGFAGLSVFSVLIGFYMHGIAARVVEGIRLRLANAELAEQLQVALARVQAQAATDPLTGAPNRRALDELLAQAHHAALGQGQGFAVLMLDIDHFKQVNDTHGHPLGDAVLCAFASRVQAQLRRGDVCARQGGEEFVVVLPGASLAFALEVAERLRLAVAGAPLVAVPQVSVTVSIGAASHAGTEGVAELLARADAAVYRAKTGGRNRVVAAEAA